MLENVGELVTGKKTTITKKTEVNKKGEISHIYVSDNEALLLSDTDSVEGSSIVRTNFGTMTIEELFELGTVKFHEGREFSFLPGLESDCSDGHRSFSKPVKMIYRHRVKKPRWRIVLEDGKSVVVTGDHSIMVMRNDRLIEVKPAELNMETDMCVSVNKAAQ